MHLRHQLAAYSPVSAGSVLASAAALLAGSHGEQLDALLRREYQADDVLLVDSGTHALQIAIEVAVGQIGAHPTVAFPAFSCFDIATAAVGAKVDAMLYDIDPGTLGPDQESLDLVLRAGARIVVVAPLYGVPVDWDAIEGLANRHGAVLIEDAAQGHGAMWRGRMLGSLGTISILSFSRGKGWTGGHGGAVLFRGGATPAGTFLEPSSRAAETRNVIGLGAQWILGRPSLYGIPRSIPQLGLGETRYHPPTQPRPMPASSAGALLAGRPTSLHEATIRRGVAAQWIARLTDIRPSPVIERDGTRAGYLRFPLRRKNGMAGFRDASLASRLGIAPSYPSLLASVPAMRSRLIGQPPDCVGAVELVDTLVTLPTHSRLTRMEIDQIVDLVNRG